MVAGAKVLAIVPARGGSKSIPRKNIRVLGGHPLVAYSIAAGLQADTVDRVIVSTEDEEIAQISQGYGAELPFRRPERLARDDTPDLPVFQHALEWLAQEGGYEPEVVVQLRPTSPLRPRDCVDGAVRLLLEHPEADCVRGVVPSGQNPFKMWRIQDGRLQPLLDQPPEAYNMPRQQLPSTHWQTGHIDAIRSSTISDKGSMTGQVILPWHLDARYAIDLDTLQDWARAEWTLAQVAQEVVQPGRVPRPLPDQVDLLVLDFDGVLTNDRVWVDQEGGESVAASRSDGYGIARLKERGVQVVVLSKESNPVVAARCRKLDIEAYQGIDDKNTALSKLLADRGIEPEHVVCVGNDINDLAVFPKVACAAAVADAHPEVAAAADLHLSKPGGHGAVRELCDLLIDRMGGKGDDG